MIDTTTTWMDGGFGYLEDCGISHHLLSKAIKFCKYEEYDSDAVLADIDGQSNLSPMAHGLSRYANNTRCMFLCYSHGL